MNDSLKTFFLAAWGPGILIWDGQGVLTLPTSAPWGLPTLPSAGALRRFWPTWVSSSCSVQGRQRSPSPTMPPRRLPSSSRQAAGLSLRTNPGTWLSDFCNHAFPTNLISVLFSIQLTGTFCLWSSPLTLFSFYRSLSIFRYHLIHQWSDTIHLLIIVMPGIWGTFTYIILFNP